MSVRVPVRLFSLGTLVASAVASLVGSAVAVSPASAAPIRPPAAHAPAARVAPARVAPARVAPARVAPARVAPARAAASCPATIPARPVAELDGFGLGALPRGLGGQVSDFAYEWGGVAFTSRVWERGPDRSGAYSVDLSVDVLRGPRLTSAGALREFLAHYLEQDTDTWATRAYDFHGRPGYLTDDRAFWLDRKGVAVLVDIDRTRFSHADLVRTACGIVPVHRPTR